MISSRPCQVVLVATETPDVVDLGDAVGYLMHAFTVSQRRSGGEAPVITPSPKTGKKESVVTLSPTTAGSPASPAGPTSYIMFDRTGLGGDPSAPAVLEGEDFAAALVQALNRISEQSQAGLSAADPNRIVVVGCPSVHAIDAIAKSAHELRMLVTITSAEPFPAPPSAVPTKGPKKPEPKKGGPGAKAAGKVSSASASTTVRLERYLRRHPSVASEDVRYVRAHVAAAATVEGLLVTAVIPELLSLESTYQGYYQWMASKHCTTISTGRMYRLAEHTRYVAESRPEALHGRQAVGIGGGDSQPMWNLGDALNAVVSQSVANREVHASPSLLVHRIDTAALATLRSQAAVDVKETEGSGELPRKGKHPTTVQHRDSIAESDGSQVQWLVRQFVKRSLGKLRLESDTAQELTQITSRGSNKSRWSGGGPVAWNEATVQSLTQVIRTEGTGEYCKTDRTVPQGALILQRAVHAAEGSSATAIPHRNKPNIHEELVAAVERSHTQQEIQRGLVLTMLEQVVREEFPNLAAAGFETQSYLFSEAITETEMNRRLTQMATRYGSHVRVFRVPVDDSATVNALSAHTSLADRLTRAPQPKELVIAGVAVPECGSRRNTASIAMTAPSVPSFAAYATWTATAAALGGGGARALQVASAQQRLSSGSTSPQLVTELLRQTNFVSPQPLADADCISQQSFAKSLGPVEDAVWSVFPYDNSVVEVRRRRSTLGVLSHSVRYAKDDVVAALHKRGGNGAPPRFVGTFDDGVVITFSPPPSAAEPVVERPPSVGGDSLASSSPSPSRVETAQSAAGAAESATRLSSAGGVGALQPTPSVGDPLPLGTAGGASGAAADADSAAQDKVEQPPVTEIPLLDVVISYGNLSVRVDEIHSNITFYFYESRARECLLEGTLDGEEVQTFVEFEISRLVDHRTGSVLRHFASGSRQLLQAEGTVATLIVRPSHPQPFWLSTLPSGELLVRGGYAGAPKARRLENMFCDVRQTVDRENACDIFSRNDGVVIAFYRVGGLGDHAQSCHTRVVTHSDGTVIVSNLSAGIPASEMRAVPPALAAIANHMTGLKAIGDVSHVVITPQCPRIFLFRRRDAFGAASVTTVAAAGRVPAVDGSLLSSCGEFFIEFGDGSVLKRQAVPHYRADRGAMGPSAAPIDNVELVGTNKVLLQTVFCRNSESTIRCNHDSGLIFVETHTVHLAPLSMTSVALCEGVAIFDVPLGAFRLVDFRAHVTSIDGIFNMTVFPRVRGVEPSNETLLLIEMAPTGYAPHVYPKKQRDEYAAAAEAERIAVEERGCVVAPMIERLRALAGPYIAENRLISKGVRRQPNRMGETVGSAPVQSVRSVGSGANPTTQSIAASMHTAGPCADRAASDHSTLFLTEVRPLLFSVYDDGRVTATLAAQDMASFVHSVTISPTPVTVSRTYASGEPGIEQLTFVGGHVSSFGNLWRHQPFDRSAKDDPCLPRTMLPPRRLIEQKHATTVGSKAVALSVAEEARVLLRYQPLARPARTVCAKQEVLRQAQVLAMHSYDAAIQGTVPVVPESILREQLALRNKYFGAQHSGAAVVGSDFTSPPPPQHRVSHESALSRQDAVEANAQHHHPDAPAVPYTAGAPSFDDAASSSVPAGQAANVRRQSKSNERSAGSAGAKPAMFSFDPAEADFGTILSGYRYALPVVLHSHTTDTLLFEVFRPKRKRNGVQMLSVQTSSFILSPMSTSTVYVMLNLPTDIVDVLPADANNAEQHIVDECLRMECAQLHSKVELRVSAKVKKSPGAASSTGRNSPHHAALGSSSARDGDEKLRKPKVDTLTPPISRAELHESGYFADMVVLTNVRLVGKAV